MKELTEGYEVRKFNGQTKRFCQTLDLRETIHPKHSVSSGFQPQPYYQVFALKHGFQPNISCIDLLFQMGPESLLTLQTHNQY